MPTVSHNRAIWFWIVLGLLAISVAFVAVRQIIVIERQQAIIDNNSRQDALDSQLISEVAHLKIELESHIKTVDAIHPQKGKR